VDEDGNFIIISNGTVNGEPRLEDVKGNRVNKRGYLLNNNRQVVTREGVVIFNRDEVDEDDEIPAPFCYQKHKELGHI